MLPNAEDAPTADAEQLANRPVAIFIAFDFELPILAILAGHPNHFIVKKALLT